MSTTDLNIMSTDTSRVPAGLPAEPLQTVLKVLRDIRPLQSSGIPYDEHSNLTDAGFTSVEMVKVMLGVEAAFDLMIPQEMITPENFTSATTIARLIGSLQARAAA